MQQNASWVRERTHRGQGGKSFLVEWSDSKAGTKHECSWEPEENLTHCAQLLREWFKLGLTAQKHILTEAKAIGINAVSMSGRKLFDTEWLVVTDLSQAEYDYNTMLVRICLAAGIALSEVLFLWASPPCNSISPCGTVNDLSGSGYRIYSDPTWPPRTDGSKYAKIA